MAKKTHAQSTKSCSDCVHEYACRMWTDGRMISDESASRCPNHTTVKESAAYLIGKMDGEKHATPTADVAPRAEWISVEDRLPGVSGRYICAVKDKNGHTWTVAGDYSLEMKTWFGLMFGEIKNTVTHWMPLPEPPKENP